MSQRSSRYRTREKIILRPVAGTILQIDCKQNIVGAKRLVSINKVSDDKIHETSHGKLFIGTFEQNTKFIRNVTHLEKVMNIDVR